MTLKHISENYYKGALIALSLAAVSCGNSQKNTQQNQPTPVVIQPASLQPAIYYDEYPGNIVALSQVDIKAEVGGYITGIFFKEGDHVKKGQRLYEIDRSKYQASYAQALANVQVAKANELKAQKDADRYIYLSKHDAVAKQTLDHALTDLQNAKSQVASANADLVKAQTDLKYSIITAPFDGVIGLSQVKMGTLITADQTLLNTISTDNPVAVDFVVNEKQISRFQQIKNENIPAQDSLFTLRMPDNNLYNLPGKLSVIDRAVDPQTGTIKIRLLFPNPDQSLRTGMSCIVRVHSQEKAEQILIPAKAIVEQMGENFVFVAKDTVMNENNKDKKETTGSMLIAEERKVQVGQVIDSNIIIQSGLEQGDKVIVEGIQKLHSGSPITTGKPTPPANAQNAKH